MTRDAAISVRVEPELKQALEELAKADKRTLASYVAIVLQAHVDERGKPKARGR
jgi:predicted DNA-binding protein